MRERERKQKESVVNANSGLFIRDIFIYSNSCWHLPVFGTCQVRYLLLLPHCSSSYKNADGKAGNTHLCESYVISGLDTPAGHHLRVMACNTCPPVRLLHLVRNPDPVNQSFRSCYNGLEIITPRNRLEMAVKGSGVYSLPFFPGRERAGQLSRPRLLFHQSFTPPSVRPSVRASVRPRPSSVPRASFVNVSWRPPPRTIAAERERRAKCMTYFTPSPEMSLPRMHRPRRPSPLSLLRTHEDVILVRVCAAVIYLFELGSSQSGKSCSDEYILHFAGWQTRDIVLSFA